MKDTIERNNNRVSAPTRSKLLLMRIYQQHLLLSTIFPFSLHSILSSSPTTNNLSCPFPGTRTSRLQFVHLTLTLSCYTFCSLPYFLFIDISMNVLQNYQVNSFLRCICSCIEVMKPLTKRASLVINQAYSLRSQLCNLLFSFFLSFDSYERR